MIPLGLASIAMWVLIVERVMSFRALERKDLGVQDAVHAVQGEDVAVIGSGLRATMVRMFLQERTGDPDLDKHIVEQCALRVRPQLSKFLAVIAVLAGIAPLLGLLGTVIGMIETFDVISIFGTGNARALAGGISVALVTTQSGLLVAIPGLFLSATLIKRANNLMRNLDEIKLVMQHHLQPDPR
jgi:biopolymer transport protein ExbB